MQSPCVTPDAKVIPRVFVKKAGSDYTEIPGIQSFEREDNEDFGTRLSFVVDDAAQTLLNNGIFEPDGESVEVKMEFSIGMLMVMAFSGFVESIAPDSIVFVVSSEVSTEVMENPDSKFH